MSAFIWICPLADAKAVLWASHKLIGPRGPPRRHSAPSAASARKEAAVAVRAAEHRLRAFWPRLAVDRFGQPDYCASARILRFSRISDHVSTVSQILPSRINTPLTSAPTASPAD